MMDVHGPNLQAGAGAPRVQMPPLIAWGQGLTAGLVCLIQASMSLRRARRCVWLSREGSVCIVRCSNKRATSQRDRYEMPSEPATARRRGGARLQVHYEWHESLH